MSSKFTEAVATDTYLRMALSGPTGSGKTLTALRIAQALGAKPGVIDTEHRTASKYVGTRTPYALKFLTLALDSHHPDRYIEAIKDAEEAGIDVCVIDSLSHAWTGKDGALEQVDRAARKSGGGNSFAGWRDVTPIHNRLVDAMLGCRMHLIVTMRSKMEYVLEDVNGKKVPRKVGMAPVQRDGVEYEFDICGELTLDNELFITKTRCFNLNGKTFRKPGPDLAKILAAWVGDGGEAQRPAPDSSPKVDDSNAKGARAELFNSFVERISLASSEEVLAKLTADIKLCMEQKMLTVTMTKDLIADRDARRSELAKESRPRNEMAEALEESDEENNNRHAAIDALT